MESARSKVRESLNRLLGHTWATRLPGMLLICSTVLLLVYSAFAAGLKPGVMNLDGALTDKRSDTCTPEYTAGLDEEFISENGCPSVVQAHVSLDSINLGARKEAALRVRLYPDGDLGMSLQNGGVLFGGTLLSFESTGENNHYLDADVWANAQTATVPLKSNGTAANYPFDAYQGQWSVLLQSSETGETLPLWLTAAKAEVAISVDSAAAFSRVAASFIVFSSQMPISGGLKLVGPPRPIGQARLELARAFFASKRASMRASASLVPSCQ